MKKKIDITERYSIELDKISDMLNNLEYGHIYDLTKVKMHGSLNTNIKQLKKMLSELLYKIEYDKDSSSEEMGHIISAIMNKNMGADEK